MWCKQHFTPSALSSSFSFAHSLSVCLNMKKGYEPDTISVCHSDVLTACAERKVERANPHAYTCWCEFPGTSFKKIIYIHIHHTYEIVHG